MKKATTVEEQIEILKSRNMLFDLGEDKAKEILLDIGYYRLGFFWHPFQLDSEHNFKLQTKFSNIVHLYYLDIDLKYNLIRILNRLEIHLRTQIIYHLSNKHQDNPIWFVDKKVVNEGFINGFHKIYNEDFIRSNKQIKKHHQKYINDKYAPAWKTIEYLSFGSIKKLFENLKDEKSKEEIANKYGIKKVSVFENYLKTAVFVRNICAHGGCLFDSNTPTEIKLTPFINFNQNENNRHSLDSQIKVLLYLINQISENRYCDYKNEIDKLFNSFKENEEIANVIRTKIGYIFK